MSPDFILLGYQEASMPTVTNDNLASRAHGVQPMNLVATGWALTCALVGLYVLCYLAAFAWPTAGLAHGWLALFATEPGNVVRTFVEGVAGSTVGAWVAAAFFVPTYNRLAAG
jgi:hypothetical protein